MPRRLTQPELVLDARSDLGECPTWDDRRRVLLWIDIHAGRVHSLDPVSGEVRTTEVGQPVGALAPRERGGLVLALQGGFALLDPESGGPRLVAEVEAGERRTRLNDGKCDAAGRFWAGTMEHEGREPIGSLYRLDPGGAVRPMVTGVSLSNGLGWSPDRRTMYYVDSPTRRVDAFDFDLAAGEVANRRTLVALEREAGIPDGLAVDAEGHVWLALWGGSAVRRYSPSGQLAGIVDLPASLITSCTFGGPDLDELYITSARRDLRRPEPAAGGIFRVRPGVTGLPVERYAG